MKLTKKEIVSRGYYHRFRNNQTGEIVNIKCTQEEYRIVVGPTLEGHTFINSVGGCPEIETENGIKWMHEGLKDGEYVEPEEGNKIGKLENKLVKFEEGDINDNEEFIGIIKEA